MITFIILVLIVIIAFLLVGIYRYDNTQFSKETGYQYIDLWTNPTAKLVNEVNRKLSKIAGDGRIFYNVAIQVNNTTLNADAVLLHESGVYVMKVVKKKGWISGREQDIQWYEQLHKDVKLSFDNPMNDVKKVMYAMQDTFAELNTDVINGLVLFTDNCSFKKIEVSSEKADVLKIHQLATWSKTLGEAKFTSEQLEVLAAEFAKMVQKKEPKEKTNRFSSSEI